jgi:hypothetical protein
VIYPEYVIPAIALIVGPSLLFAITRGWLSFAAVSIASAGLLSYVTYEVVLLVVQDSESPVASIISLAAVVVTIVAWFAVILTAATMAYRIATARKKTMR